MDEAKKVGTSNTFLNPALAGLQETAATKERKKDELGKTEFLQLLITQLKNQDPLDPMKGDEFAVNLAQFSQLEQLIGINDKIGADQSSDPLSLAAYLGTEVTLKGDSVNVDGGEGGLLKLDLLQDAAQVTIELVDAAGTVRQTLDTGEVAKGKQTVSLSGLQVPDGDYTVKVSAIARSGAAFKPQVATAGIVSGFIPGPEPTLLVGGREVSPSDVTEVNIPAIAAS